MSDRAFKKLDSLIMAITENACGNGSAEDVAEKREALESHIHGMQSRLDSLEKDAARLDHIIANDALIASAGGLFWLEYPLDGARQVGAYESVAKAIDTAMQSQGATE